VVRRTFRPTATLICSGDDAPASLLEAFWDICGVEVDDGVQFDVDGLTVDRISDDAENGGLRLKNYATIATARVRVTVDIGFGDAIEPGIAELDLLVLLDLPSPRIRAYPREAVIAEKFHAMVVLGRANSRMKEFYDVWLLSRVFEFNGESLARNLCNVHAAEDVYSDDGAGRFDARLRRGPGEAAAMGFLSRSD
jgi:hypothetical protein